MIGIGIDAPDFYILSDKGPYIIIDIPEPGTFSIYPFENPWSFKGQAASSLHRLIRTIFDSKNFRL